jgi:hypothetical protein
MLQNLDNKKWLSCELVTKRDKIYDTMLEFMFVPHHAEQTRRYNTQK